MQTDAIWRIAREFKDHSVSPFYGIYGTKKALIKALRQLVQWYREGNEDDVYDIYVKRADLNSNGVFVWQRDEQSILRKTSKAELKELGIID